MDLSLRRSALEKLSALSFKDVGLTEKRSKPPQISLSWPGNGGNTEIWRRGLVGTEHGAAFAERDAD